MNKYMNYSDKLKQIVLIVITVSIFSRYKIDGIRVIYYSLFFVLLIINDFYRVNKLYKYKNKYNFSILISIIGGTILAYFTRGYTSIYIFMTIYEILMFNNGIVLKTLTSIQITLILILQLSSMSDNNILSKDFWMENSIDLLMYIFLITSYILAILFMKVEIREKKKVKKLNKDLEESYEKLKEYSFKIEELTIAKERNRVAGEIHDSLGHSLTALIIHLDYIEKILYNDTEKVKELIQKTQILARNSMNEVRKAVYALKDELVETSLIDSISELKNNLALDDDVDIKHKIIGEIEKIDPNYKNVIYRTIQEALTNSIKHGKASEIIIKICRFEDEIILEIIDNGIGCNKVIEGNGIKAISERISALGGEYNYYSKFENGFSIKISIPYEEVDYEKNKINAC